jgi:hypothetical protein
MWDDARQGCFGETSQVCSYNLVIDLESRLPGGAGHGSPTNPAEYCKIFRWKEGVGLNDKIIPRMIVQNGQPMRATRSLLDQSKRMFAGSLSTHGLPSLSACFPAGGRWVCKHGRKAGTTACAEPHVPSCQASLIERPTASYLLMWASALFCMHSVRQAIQA